MLIYYLGFSNNQEVIDGVSSCSENKKNAEIGYRTDVKNTSPLDYSKIEG